MGTFCLWLTVPQDAVATPYLTSAKMGRTWHSTLTTPPQRALQGDLMPQPPSPGIVHHQFGSYDSAVFFITSVIFDFFLQL